VSEAFLQAVQENTRRYYWTGKITTKKGVVHEFGAEDIVKGSGCISSQCCGSTEIELGTVYSAELGITLFSQIDRYTLEDALVELFYHLRLADGSYEEVPMGIFEVSEANRTVKCLELKAYDFMLRFEKSFNGFETVGTAYDFISLCCKSCAVEFAQSQSEIEAMPNGTEMLSIYTDNDIETYRDVLYYVGQVLGGFFCINRYGKLEFRKYGNEPVMTVESKHRFSSSFSDFITRYTAVSSTNMRTEMAEYYHLDPDDGLTMNLGVNPLLQFGLDETRKQLCTNILNDIAVVDYVPFDSDTIGNSALDLGDVIRFVGGQADGDRISAITSMQCKIGGKHSLKGVGKNTRLAQAKSKNDKNISGLLNQIEAGKIGIHTFTNASAYTVAEVNAKIISIEFATSEENHAQFFGQVIVDVKADAVERSAVAKGTIVVPESGSDAAGSDGADASGTEDSAYLLGAMNGSKLRYEGLKGCTDYKKAVQILKDGGYATSLTYVEKLCSIIERWKLTQYDVKGEASDVVKYYRVRKSWADAASQLGAYSVLDNAKVMADKHSGYTVYDWNGKAVYGAEVSGGKGSIGEFSNAECPFLVKVSIDDLNIRKGAGTNTAKTGNHTGVGVFTIIQVKSGCGSILGWGKLKSGAGWISLDYCEKVS
jgi:hypothetical protein